MSVVPAATATATRIVVTGTDTGIGKTVFAAALADALGASYWKPVQAGLDEESDSATVARLGCLPPERVLAEAHRLTTPASPHLAARLDGVRIDAVALEPPPIAGPLVIEGAGGPMVPLDDDRLFIDVFARWRLPVVLVARSGLGTINHTLLALEALRRRAVPILGVALVGEAHDENARMIARLGDLPVLGRLPMLASLTAEALRAAFAAHFDVAAFTAPHRVIAPGAAS